MFKKTEVSIGISPIAWTNDDVMDIGDDITFEQCISEMALAGFQGCEIGRKFPQDPQVLKSYLEPRGLRIFNEWFPTYLTSGPKEKTYEAFDTELKKLHALGCHVIGASEQGFSIQAKDVPIFGDDKPVFTDRQWRLICEGYNEMGKKAREKDIFFAVHHHMGTGIQTEEEIDRLMENTDPDYVFLVFCIGHMQCAGNNLVKMMEKHIKRIRHVHLKDVRMDIRKKTIDNHWSFIKGVAEGLFTIPGEGSVDFKPLFQIMADNDYEGCLMVEAEQDPKKANPFLYAKKARGFVNKYAGL